MSDDSAADAANEMLKDFKFLYADLDHTDRLKAFKSPFCVRLLATSYFLTIRGFTSVPSLGTEILAKTGFLGILGLCGAAVCAIHDH